MICGNSEVVYIEGATYIRVANLGYLKMLCEKQGMSVENILILDAAIEELHNSLMESMYKEVKSKIPEVPNAS